MNDLITIITEQSPIIGAVLGLIIGGIAWVYRELRKAIFSLQNKINLLEQKVENYQVKVEELRYTIGKYEGKQEVAQVVLDSISSLKNKLEIIDSKL